MIIQKSSFYICRNILYALLIVLLTQLLFFQTLSIAQDEPTLKDLAKSKPEAENTKETDEAVKTPDKQEADKDTKQLVIVDEFRRDTPSTAIEAFLSVTTKRDYDNAANHLRLTKLPKGYEKADGPELARMLRILINQKTLDRPLIN